MIKLFLINQKILEFWEKGRLIQFIPFTFNALGLLNPIIAKWKTLFQDVCCEKSVWDDILPESYLAVYVRYRNFYLKEFIEFGVLEILLFLCKFMVFRFPLKINFVKVVLVSAISRVVSLRKNFLAIFYYPNWYKVLPTI